MEQSVLPEEVFEFLVFAFFGTFFFTIGHLDSEGTFLVCVGPGISLLSGPADEGTGDKAFALSRAGDGVLVLTGE